MRTTRQLSITLPNDMADVLRDKVSAGDYASESEVIREGLRAAYDAAIEDTSRTVSAQALRDRSGQLSGSRCAVSGFDRNVLRGVGSVPASE